MKLIKLSNTEVLEKRFYKNALKLFYSKSVLVNKYVAWNFAFLESFGIYSLLAVLAYGSYQISANLASSEMLGCSIYAFYLGMGFRSVLNSYTELKKTAAVYEGLDPLLGNL
jgi:ABC-type multidrug transport system fused ATPase/permease subunit